MKHFATRPALLLFLIAALHSISNPLPGKTAEEQAKLYFFTNPSCGPCRLVEPEVEELFRDGYSIMKIDTTLHPDWTQRFQVDRTPTVVLAAGDQVLARHSGYIDSKTLKRWFAAVTPRAGQPQPRVQPSSTAVNASRSDTAHNGTYRPGNEIERLALQATVKLKIDDPLGSSYATGTVIHSVNGEALVLTCGHVFRDSDGKGTISAEYGFTRQATKIAKGELLFYDADARDIGLVAISTDHNIEPVPLANIDFPVQKSASIFTIGCDQGDRPSIRRSKVLNQAKYDGVNKYEIHGRPVNGRSGGGMFTADGKLVGVCNAAVVDVDEGVYVALDTIHWQLAKVNLNHLFDDSSTAIAAQTQPHSLPSNRMTQIDSQVRPRDLAAIPIRTVQEQFGNDLNTRPVNNSSSPENETEMIVILRGQNSNGMSESWTVTNPSLELVAQLKNMRTDARLNRDSSNNRFAQLRRDMPILPQAAGKNYNRGQMRAQSPR